MCRIPPASFILHPFREGGFHEMRRYQFRGRWWSLLSVLALLGGGGTIGAWDDCPTGERLPWWKHVHQTRPRALPSTGAAVRPILSTMPAIPSRFPTSPIPRRRPTTLATTSAAVASAAAARPVPPTAPGVGTTAACAATARGSCWGGVTSARAAPSAVPIGSTDRGRQTSARTSRSSRRPGHKSEHEEEHGGGDHHIEHHAEPLKGNGGGH